MKITCFCKKNNDIIVPDIENIRKKYNKKLRYGSFVNDRWSDRDIEGMIKGYERVKAGKLTVKELTGILGKSYSSLKNKAWRMGISHR
jgi:hypothetical protein